MSVTRIANRYAKSLFDIAEEHQKLEKVFEDIQMLEKICHNEEFHNFLKSPIIGIERKKNVFLALLKNKSTEETLQTLYIIIEHKREKYLLDICTEFEELYLTAQHISRARLVTAEAISDELAHSITAEFQAAQLLDSSVKLVREVNPALMGGFVLYFADKVYDASIAFKIGALENKFNENLYIKNF
jgi:F-type H+-transporting ATPase subunit delta